MSPEAKGRNWFVIVAVWLPIVVIVTLGVKYFLFPFFDSKLEKETGSESRYSKGQITLAADSFNGYAIFRTDEFINRQKERGIRFVVKDDQANYKARIDSLKNGDIDMAVFTIDSFIKASALIKQFPGSIVMVIDESSGADGFVAYESAITSLQELNYPEAKIVLTLNSPTEFFARVLVSHLSVNISESKWVEAEGSTDVLARFKKSDKNSKQAYGLWEPELSQVLEIPGVKLLIDSSKLKGYIIDVLVVNREFLKDHQDMVHDVVEDYQKTLYSYQQGNGLADLVRSDAKKSGIKLTDKQVERIVGGIVWKNTLENYAHFGLLSGQESKGLENLEDIIANVSKVLVQTGSMSENPTLGKEHNLFFSQVLSGMKDADFHPGRAVNILSDDVGVKLDLDEIQERAKLSALTDEQWEQLVPEVEMRTVPINFGRGRASITIQGQRDLNELAKNLEAWPDYYLLVVGNASTEGDIEANVQLAKKRSESVVEYLISGGMNENRIKAKASAPSGKGAKSRTVEFVLAQKPY